jgi:hypothetical protein
MNHYDRMIRKARLLCDSDRLTDAEQLYRKLLKELPDDTLAMHDLSIVMFRQGRRWEAMKLLTATLNKNGDFAGYFATMAEFLDDPVFGQEMQNSWGGPFNGQTMRRRIFTDIIARIPPDLIFETGTYRGATTHFMASATTAHVFSCENHIDTMHFARRRLGSLPNVSLFHLDSRSFLKQLVPLYCRPDRTTFFYLDAHWSQDLPLIEELQVVLETAPRSVVMIDDFQVPDDPGYVFDDYGAGRVLCPDYLAPIERYAPSYFFPGPSDQEDGLHRGCVVLTVEPAFAATLTEIADLRPAQNSRSKRNE